MRTRSPALGGALTLAPARRNGWPSPWPSWPLAALWAVRGGWHGRSRTTRGRAPAAPRPASTSRKPTTSPSRTGRPASASTTSAAPGPPSTPTSTSSREQDPDLYQRYRLAYLHARARIGAWRDRDRTRGAGAVPRRGRSLPGPGPLLRRAGGPGRGQEGRGGAAARDARPRVPEGDVPAVRARRPDRVPHRKA